MSRQEPKRTEDPAQQPTEKASAPARTGAVVTVALKHPTGIVLDELRKETGREPVLGGGFRDVDVWRPTGRTFTLHGNATPFGVIPTWPIVGKYALTQGVPKDLWENWLKHHHDHPLVERKLISAHERLDMAEDFAKEHASTRSGMEKLLQKDDPRVPKKKLKDGTVVDEVGVASEQPAAA